MPERRLHDLGRPSHLGVAHKRVGGGYRDRIGPQPAGLEQHAGRKMEHLADAALIKDLEIGAWIIRAHRRFSPSPAAGWCSSLVTGSSWLGSRKADGAGLIDNTVGLQPQCPRQRLGPLFGFFLAAGEKNRGTPGNLAGIVTLRERRHQPLSTVFKL